MELTFLVGSDGANVKRGQARRACNSCRHKKKRCYHNEDQGLFTPVPSIGSSAISSSQSPPRRSRRDPTIRSRSASPPLIPTGGTSLQDVTSESTSPLNVSREGLTTETQEESRRFACDSNPMAALVEKEESRLHKGRSKQGDVGAWLCPDECSIEQPGSASKYVPHPGTGHHREHPINAVDTQHMPPQKTQDLLLDIYFRRVHPILPLLDEETTRSQFQVGKLPACLIQAICLVAAKDPTAAHSLYLGHHEEPVSFKEFSSIIYNDLLRKIPRRSERNVLTIQVLALLSLHEWGATGSEDCSLNLAQAIHHAQTLGFHLMRPDQHTLHSSKALFWCLWSLDRWNAAMNGRPLMIHDGDRGQEVNDVVPSFEPPFQIWLRVADKLGEVIHRYRPTKKHADQGDLDLPSFEEIVEQCEAWDIDADHLDSLDFIYHSVIILSTHSNGLQGRLRPRISNIRQDHSILTLATLSCDRDIGKFLPLPMIGYTISLAFSVAYKQIRASKLPSARHTALPRLRLFHRCLQKLSTTWWPAAVMARLGHRVLNNIQPTIDQERNTDHGIDITRLNSQPESHHLPNHPSDSSLNLPSYSNFEFGDPSGRTEPRSDSAHPLNGNYLGPTHLSHLNELNNGPSLSAELEEFDLFFGNFPDLNFPSCANDPLLLDLDVGDFDFVTDRPP
ncbi:unnamed protein product [Penicillium salamii]|uniref:Xylanolytic transcriptional activator regulatory domain-containing protein n=1 Tax=Penicillium salamii TaxID=1612424 RepID=A0A9W4IQQ3_9EURO|nr:unnamed protein product [Penicillium salamii]CAG8044597.1 unnamed protein product [Penicillium salamii]CAG8335324.1 unnamed protein product [Penicillium salamii]CAG8335541.1 unnamed protein product [Penicillium salamii]CAG8343954.1 unnamed protein product [Penicillium salamii]